MIDIIVRNSPTNACATKVLKPFPRNSSLSILAALSNRVNIRTLNICACYHSINAWQLVYSVYYASYYQLNLLIRWFREEIFVTQTHVPRWKGLINTNCQLCTPWECIHRVIHWLTLKFPSIGIWVSSYSNALEFDGRLSSIAAESSVKFQRNCMVSAGNFAAWRLI